MRTPLHNHLTACVGLKRPRDVRPAMALDLACHAWRERVGREVEAAVDVLRVIRWDRSATAKAVGRRLRTYLVQVFLLSLPAQRSPEGYLAWLSKPCPAMDRDERAQHLLAFFPSGCRTKRKRGCGQHVNNLQHLRRRSDALHSTSSLPPWIRCGQCDK